MKQILRATVLSMALGSFPVMAHHAAEGIVDDEIYDSIDDMVDDTPHAEMTTEDLAYELETTITTQTLTALETMVDDGLLDYASMLDGEVTVTIEFNNDGTTTAVITQAL